MQLDLAGPLRGMTTRKGGTVSSTPAHAHHQQTTPRHCTTQRHLVLVLCFHRHSRFVPSNSSREVESRESKGDKQSASYRLTSWFGFATARLLDSSTARLFVFIDILALFPRFSYFAHYFGFTNEPRQRPSPWGEGGESSEPGEGFLDFLSSSFVFIYILALFPRFWNA